MNRRIVLAGGRGFLGQALARWFGGRGWEVVMLTRTPARRTDGVCEVGWDGETVADWAATLDGAAAVVNLAGKSVNCRYHERNRREILASRLGPTRVIGAALAQCTTPPRVWLNASTATIYQHTLGPAWDEAGEVGGTPEAKDEFPVEVATAWEREFFDAPTPNTRKVALRTAMVLGRGRNSVFPMLRRLTRLGLGGRMGSGRQFVSWIHEADFCRAVEWLIAHGEIDGVVNVAAPNPLTNAAMMRTFRELCGMPFGLPATNWMLEIGAVLLRTETELILKSRRVVPGRLLAGGFAFHFPTFCEAAGDLMGLKPRQPMA
ncbi:MAG TPA: TIGR01777 family oxidoreductase [Verrucomicrobiae bacterium]|nr:TIGR01777 family oxidoreductase [Verrucomicrobiae bacterium]